jgi:glycosyltransferase involved in cell wall biosynthesis
VKILERNEPFNWAKLNNDGANESKGELLLFLNDDIEVLDGSWLKNLVSNAVREDVGSVGAMLLYPDGRVQHGGVFLVDHGGGARHYLHFLNPEQPIYQDLHQVVREVSASTGACLMIRRSIFEEMNGFDEDLAIVGNDVDICLRIHKAGYRNIWTPECVLIHHESVSRKEIKITEDEGKMWSRWGDEFIKGDPYYNPNLTNTKTDCSLRDFPPSDFEVIRSTDKLVPGINLVAYIRAEMGVGEASRSMACAMDRAEVPFCIINYEHGNPSRMMDHSWDHKIVSEPEYDINLFHINADLIPEVIHNLPKSFTKNKYNIGLWAWELPEFPDRWLKSFSYLDEIWVPSEFVRQAVMEKSPIPVFTIPHAVRSMNQPYLKRSYFNLPEDRFLFLSMYDVHSIQERKNPKGAIEAYKLAFPNETTRVSLVVKVNNASETELTEIKSFIGERSDIIFINRILSRYEVDSLISCCDCFISLHRSEGFGLVIAEAMTLGKPVIATNWSGNQDFMSAENAVCVNYSLAKLEKDHGPYDAGQHWAEPDISHAASWMTRLVKEPELCRVIGGRSKTDVINGLSSHEIGQIIVKRLKSL